jgi:hypothetical protein
MRLTWTIEVQPSNEFTKEAIMTTLFHAQESSPNKGMKIAVVIAILGVGGLALWAGFEMVLRLTTGRS